MKQYCTSAAPLLLASSLAAWAVTAQASPVPPYWQYVSPFDGTMAEGSWGDVESFSESNVNSHLGAGYACTWASGEPVALDPGDYFGDWGGTQPSGQPCSGRFKVTRVACHANETWRVEANACVPVTDEAPPQTNGSCPKVGDPISPLNGANSQSQAIGNWFGFPEVVTYDSAMKVPSNDSSLSFQGRPPASFGPMWQDAWHRRLWFQNLGTAQAAVQASRGQWLWVGFHTDDNGDFNPSADVVDRLTPQPDGTWIYYDQTSGAEEVYSADGTLQKTTSIGGRLLTFSYNTAVTTDAPATGLLTSVSDAFGRTLQFQYEASAIGLPPHVYAIVDPAKNATSFKYDVDTDNLLSITWPGSSTAYTFVYENPSLSWALTGLVDENGKRTATFAYDTAGRAIDTQQAGAVNHFHVDYGTPPSWQVTDTYDPMRRMVVRKHAWVVPQGTAVTTFSGQTSNLSGTSVLGSVKLSSQSQPAGSGCAASTSSQGYDANGNITQKDDFDQHRACYAYDSTNRETTRVEGLSTSAACSSALPASSILPTGSRKISTQWHPDWRLATKVAEPGRITTYIYNGQPDPFNAGAIASCAPSTALLPDGKPIAVLCKKVEQATTDTNGRLGFSATLQSGVASRVQQWTYNAYGQVLTAKGPRTDIDDTVTYTYYGDTTSTHTIGDLQTVKNALGQTTQYTQYDPHGNVLQMIDANNVTTTYSYDLRQRLKTVSVAGVTTTYDYWPTGLLKQVSFPDTSTVSYTYDDAHRLTDVTDSFGNSVHYTLDNAGNRTAEQYKDPSGALKREIDHVIDALGRIQQTTGRE